MRSRELVLIVHNVRSSHNVGSLMRTAEGLGVKKIIFTGYTPYPKEPNDKRLPHVSEKINRDIHKTALGTEKMIKWQHDESAEVAIADLRQKGFSICALEQAAHAQPLPEFETPLKLALIVGRETKGIEPEIMALCDTAVEIPMLGRKESLNVAQAAAIALYHCAF